MRMIGAVLLIMTTMFTYNGDRSVKMINESPDLKTLFADIKVDQIPSRSFKNEFRLIDLMTLDDSENSRFILDPNFQPLHRYAEIRLFSHTMIRPDPSQPHCTTNHVNANTIINPYHPEVSEGKLRYVAAMGPMENTVDHFWRMIENNKVNNIVTIMEKDKMPGRCWLFWMPDKAKCKDYKLEIVSAKDGHFADEKVVKLTNKASKASFVVTHNLIHQWVDHYLIKEENYGDFLAFLGEMHKLDTKNPDFKLSINCSAGIGRTGTFYASYFLFGHFLDCLREKKEFTFSVISLVRFLREHRFYAVENAGQYAFLYNFVQLLEKKREDIKAYLG